MEGPRAVPPWSATPEEVAAFLQRHGRPYDEVADGYADPGPFAQSVKAGKNSAIYNAHSYHTKVPPEGIVPYLEHYTQPGDVVLDPFCGSGMTGVACLLSGRHAILNDLSPAATHIAYNYTHPVDPAALRLEFARISAAVREEFDWLYGTTCERGHPATILYTIWSDIHQCRACGEEIVLWEAAVDPEKGDVRETFDCPHCRRGPFKKTDLPLLRSEPVRTVYECLSCRPVRSEHATTVAEKARLAEIEAADIPYWYPTDPFGPEHEMWRGGHRDHGITRVCDFWTKRNLWALARLWKEIEEANPALRGALRFAFTGVCQGLTKRCRYLPGKTSFPLPIQTGTLYVPSLSKEANVLKNFRNKLVLRISILRELFPSGESAQASVIVGPSQVVPVPDAASDYIFTDPPFGSNIFYADCSLLWECWLGYHTDERYEAVWNKHRKPEQGGKTLTDYERLMTDAFREMYRVLKPGRWASVVFHNSDDRVWQAIQRGAEAAGFELVNAQQFDKVQLSFKGVRGAKGDENVTNKDNVLNLQKPRLGATALDGATLAPDVEAVIADAIIAYLRTGPDEQARGLQDLQGLAIRALLNRGYRVQVSWRSVVTALEHLGCKQVNGRWYLPGEEVAGAAGLGMEIRDEASAITWLRLLLSAEGPQTRGDLTPGFQQATVGIPLEKPLSTLLEENFMLDAVSNRWRLPTLEERERLNDAQALARRREINHLLAGTPLHRYDDAELADLMLAAYSMGLYDTVVRLSGLVDSSALPDDRRGELQRVQELAAIKQELAGDTFTVPAV